LSSSSSSNKIFRRLPIISTSRAVLRLEIWDHNTLETSKLLAFVNIPLDDLPNEEAVHNWYPLSPLSSPRNALAEVYQKVNSSSSGETNRTPQGHLSSVVGTATGILKKVPGRKSAREVLTFTSGFVTGVLSTPLGIARDLTGIKYIPDIPDVVKSVISKKRPKSMINVRVKLQVNPFGDMISHCYEQPFQPPPPLPAFNLNLVLDCAQQLKSLTDPLIAFALASLTTLQWNDTNGRFKSFVSIVVMLIHGYYPTYIPFFINLYFSLFLISIVYKHWRIHDRQHQHQQHYRQIHHHHASLDELTECKAVHREHNNNGIGNGNGGEQNNNNEGEEEAKKVAQMNRAINLVVNKFGNEKGTRYLQFFLQLCCQLGNILKKAVDGSDIATTKKVMWASLFSLVLFYCIPNRFILLFFLLGMFWGLSPLRVPSIRIALGFVRGVRISSRRKSLLKLIPNASSRNSEVFEDENE
jgi:hypothetical protein